jgi:hypothetical protein
MTRAAAGRLGVTDADLARDPATSATSGGHDSVGVRLHRFATFRVGSTLFQNPVIRVGDITLKDADMLVGARYAQTRRLFVSYSSNALFVQSEQDLLALQAAVIPALARPPGAGSAPPQRRDLFDPCRPEPTLVATLAKAQLETLSRPPPAAPPPLPPGSSGCAGAIFRLGPDGAPTDAKLVREEPSGYGVGEALLRQLAASRFRSVAPADGLFYEELRFRPRP